MTPVLYFHGFASSPSSAKIAALRPLLKPYGIVLDTPDLNVPSFARLDFDAVVDRAVEAAARTPPAAMVGSSLGALVALAASKRGVIVPLVLVAPALGVARRWQARLPQGDHVVVFNYASGRDEPIHRHFFDQMSNLYVDTDPPPARVTAIMGRRDETVPFDVVEETWLAWKASGQLVAGSRFIELPDGDHQLVAHTEVIRDAIVEAVSS